MHPPREDTCTKSQGTVDGSTWAPKLGSTWQEQFQAARRFQMQRIFGCQDSRTHSDLSRLATLVERETFSASTPHSPDSTSSAEGLGSSRGSSSSLSSSRSNDSSCCVGSSKEGSNGDPSTGADSSSTHNRSFSYPNAPRTEASLAELGTDCMLPLSSRSDVSLSNSSIVLPPGHGDRLLSAVAPRVSRRHSCGDLEASGVLLEPCSRPAGPTEAAGNGANRAQERYLRRRNSATERPVYTQQDARACAVPMQSDTLRDRCRPYAGWASAAVLDGSEELEGAEGGSPRTGPAGMSYELQHRSAIDYELQRLLREGSSQSRALGMLNRSPSQGGQ